jgi:hypothetical protein
MTKTDEKHRVLYEQHDLPIFQNRMYSSVQDAINSPRGNVRLVENSQTGLVYNADFQPDLMVYDTAYQNEQAVSQVFRRHLNQVADIIIRDMGKRNLVEVGCGKGFFLELLTDLGVELSGFDPAYEGTNPLIKREYFQPDSGIEAEGLILRHVLEHIPDPVSFLKDLRDANGGKGRIYIEVPSFDWICENKAWFDVFYEHVNYFRLSDFHRIFGSVVRSGHIFGGQYIYVVADLESVRQPVMSEGDKVVLPDDFCDTLTKINVEKNVGKLDVVWGGASKGVIFSLLRSRAGYPIDAVVDINSAKQGKYLPLTGLKVQSPSELLSQLPKNSNIYIMNQNYADEIKEMSGNAHKYLSIESAT